jgi:hypothetical protein
MRQNQPEVVAISDRAPYPDRRESCDGFIDRAGKWAWNIQRGSTRPIAIIPSAVMLGRKK